MWKFTGKKPNCTSAWNFTIDTTDMNLKALEKQCLNWYSWLTFMIAVDWDQLEIETKYDYREAEDASSYFG